ncbi:restriction endonuclease subunit S [Lactococcus cremoris]|nr:restriction endonuclease subunit S [Lactococcus cremoris]
MAKIDDSVKKKVPELRFPGFTDDWEERKLGEVGKTKSGIGFPDAQQGGKQGTPFYKVSDMNNPGNEVVMMNANNYASDSQLKENKWNPINPQNSGVVFAKVGAAIFLDRKRIVDTSFLIDNNMMSYLFDSSWNRYFGKTLFEKLRLSRFAQVGALPSFNGSDVEDIKVMRPEESEQKMIGDMFEKLDDIIALHQRKLDLLKEQKKGYLQKMFPKNGAKVPELRFAGFADDWEERKFESLLDKNEGVRRGPFGSALKKDLFVKESPYVVYEQQNAIYDHYETRYNISKEKFEELHKFELIADDFIMSGAGTIGRISKVPKGIKKGVFNQALIRFRINKELTDSEYFLQFIRADFMQRKLTGANPGSAITNLVPMSDVKKWEIKVPIKEEQQKIGSFFKQLDDTIALHQRKLDLLKEQKKGFLQKMFV